MSTPDNYQKASRLTAYSLRNVAATLPVQELSRLTLPEIDKIMDLVSKVIPAGNIPGMLLSGLTRLPGNRLSSKRVKRDINALFKGVEQILDGAVYGTFFAGPAAILWGYQNLLKLVGKNVDDAFPNGAWHFYVNYALREDTARHANETHGFDTLLRQHNIRLNAVDRLTAWVMASITCLHQFDALLANEWSERIMTAFLQDVLRFQPEASRYARIYRRWERLRPYRREAEAANMDYPTYRRWKFEQFIKEELSALPSSLYDSWKEKVEEAYQRELPLYQQQMSILAYLEPGQYAEERISIGLSEAQIGIVHKGGYYMLPVCEPGTNHPLDVMKARRQIAALLANPDAVPARLATLAHLQRTNAPEVRRNLNPLLAKELELLHFVPILINADKRSRILPLSELRQTERGIGDHPLTIFDTGETFVFDQSHIFFDGIWGAALSEIMTNEALSWAVYLSMLPPATAAEKRVYTALEFHFRDEDLALLKNIPHLSSEAAAETDKVNLRAMLALRKVLKARNDLLQLTVNDFLVLYRAIHAVTYLPSSVLQAELNVLDKNAPETVRAVRIALKEAGSINPSILIPMDATQRKPRERIFPLNVEVPLVELDLLGLHATTINQLDTYKHATENHESAYQEFEQLQLVYLATLAGFGSILGKAKEIAIQGESSSVGAIKLMAHLPIPIQRLMDKVPERFELLNNIIKGREVFSNVGAVSSSSTLTRFITAKDDNFQKQLAWGVITDAEGIMHINLRDFRPHVEALLAIGRKDLANLIAQDYLDSYANGLNTYIKELWSIALASHETKFTSNAQETAR